MVRMAWSLREQQRNDRTRPSAVVQEVVGELGAGRIELLVGPGVVLEGEGRGVGVSGDLGGEGGGIEIAAVVVGAVRVGWLPQVCSWVCSVSVRRSRWCRVGRGGW
ncbi:hypothetical protein MMRN_34200 [Mycobacterium marinum]|nr:hypothetical protein MMRN_34200 [Mycobacterium marinum]